MSTTSRRRLWRSDAEPVLELTVEPVQHGGLAWRQHVLTVQDGRPGVVALATHDGAVAFVEHWRPITGATSLELPRGFASRDAGSHGSDSALRTDAVRELSEETGLAGTIDESTVFGRFWADSGILGNEVVTVQVPLASRAPATTPDGEAGAVHWLDDGAVRRLVADGDVRDGITLAALALWTGLRRG